MVKAVLTYIVLMLLAYSAFSQGVFVDLSIEPKTVEKGQEITITIKTNAGGNINMKLPDEFVQSGVRQSGISSSIELINGVQKNVRYSFQSFVGHFEQVGKYTLGPVVVKDKRKEFKSEAYTVNVVEAQNMICADPSKNLHHPVFGIIQQSKKEIYEGESVVIEGKVYSQYDILHVDDYKPFVFAGPSNNRVLDNSSRIVSEYETIKGTNVQTFRIGKTLVFPEGVGSFKVKPFEAIIAYSSGYRVFGQKDRIISNSTEVRVKPLPDGAPKEFIDAVGRFSVSNQISSLNINQGEVVELKFKIKGRGNLQNIKEPKLNLPNHFSVYGDPEVQDSIFFTALGAEGSKTYTYFIQINKEGNYQLDPIKISYFNPVSEKYEFALSTIPVIHVNPSEISLKVEGGHQEQGSVLEERMRPYVSVNKENSESAVTIFFGSKGALLLYSPIMLGLILGLFVRVRKMEERKYLDKKLKIQHKVKAQEYLKSLKEVDSEQKVTISSQILVDYLAEHFQVDNTLITRKFLKEKVSKNLLNQESCSSIIKVMDRIDAFRYGGNIEQKSVQNIIQEIQEIIEHL